MPAWWEQPRSVAPSLSSALNVAQPPAATSEENPFLRSAMDAYRAARDRAAQNMAPPPQAAPAQQAPQPKPVFDVGNTSSAAGTFLKQVPTSLGGALAQLYVGGDRPDTYHPWARSLIDAMNRQSADNQALIDQRKAANQSDSTSESLLEASGSSGFTGASALAGLGGFAAGSAAAGPLAGGAAAMGASGAAGYRMAEAGFLDEIFSKAEAAMQAKAGRGMTEAEKADLHQKVLPIAQNTGLWEAGPEAVGNALLALGGGTALGLLGKEAVKSLASSAAKRAGVRLASGLAGVGSEVTTEGVTQFHQGNDQARADAVLAGQSPEDAKPVYEGAQGLWQATKDVAPQTLALVGMMGLGAKAAHIAARPIQQRMEGKAAGQTAIEQADLARAALHDMDESQVDTVIQQTQKALTDYPKMPKATREQLTAGLESLVADQQARTNGDAFRAAMADPEAMQTRRGQSAVLGMADPARVQQLSDGEVEAATQLADEMGRLPDMTDEQKAGFAEAAQRYRQALQARRTMAGLDEAIKTDASVIEPVIQSIQRAAFGNQKAGITPEYARAALDDGELSRHLTAIESLLDRHGDKIGERTESLEKARDVLLAEREHRATQPDWQQQNAAVRAANDPAEVRFRSAFAQAPEKAIAKLTSEHAPLINSLMQSLQTRIGNIEKTGYSAPETLTKPLALLQARKAELESAAQPSPTPAQPPVTQPITQPAQQQPTAPITSLADALQVTPTGNDPLAELIAQQQTQPRPAPVVRPRPVVPGREAKDGAAELSRLLGPQPQQQQVPAAPQQGVQSLADLLQRPSTQGAVASSPAVAQGSIAPPVALAPRPKLTQEEIKARQRKSSSAQFLPQQQKIAQHPAEAALISQPQPTGAPHEKGQAETETVLNEASPPANTEAGKALQAPDSETPKDAPPSSAPVQTPVGVGKATRVGRGVTAIELPVGAAVRESEKPDVPTEESSQQLTKLLGAFVRREIDLKTRYNKDDKTTQVITPDGHTVGAYPGILTDYEPVLSDLGRRLQQALQRERRTIPNHPSQQSLDEFSIAYELGRTIPEFEIAAEDIGSVVKTGGDGAFQVDLRALHEKIKKSGQKVLTAEADFSPATPADRQDQARREALADPEFRAAMEGYRHTTGWAERGGHLILKNADEAVSRDNIAGRTQWLPNSPWWAASTGARKGFNEAQIKNLLERFQQGEAPKNAKESRFLDFLIEDIADEKARHAESAALEAELTPQEQERLDRAEQEARAWLGEDRYEALLESLAKRYPDASPAAFSRALLDTLETALVQRNDAQQRQADVQPGTASRTGRDGAGSTEKTTESAGAAADEESAAEEKGQPLRLNDESKSSAQEKPIADNIPSIQLPSFVRENIERHFASGKGFKSITEARALIADITGKKINPGTQEAKQADEWIEQAIVRRARDIAQTNAGLDWSATFRLMTELYDQQPSLNVRTSTSVAHQAYSTPAPLAFLASRIAGVTLDTQSVVVEPTAGNGMLLMEALPKQVQANELNKDRAEFLKALGFATDERDATQWLPSKKADILIANPPFGPIKDDGGDRKTWIVPSSVAPNGEYETGEIDHAIVLKQLANLKDDGSAVLIVGGVNAPTEKSRALKYNTGAKRDFYWTLYNDYNVVDQFTIDGSLYAKQGASFPVDVIVIRGRGKSSLNVPAVNAPRIYTSWESIYEELFNDRISVWVPSRRGSGDAAGNVADAKELSGSSRGEDPAVDRPSTGNGRASTEGLAGNVPDASGFGADLPEHDVSRKGDRRSVGERGLSNGSDAGNQAEKEPRSGTDTPRRSASGADGKTGVVAQRGDRAALKASGQEQASGGQTTYQPESEQKAIGTLVPSNMAASVRAALKSLKERVGALDDYVARELGYPLRELGRYFAAEQIDALALAIDNIANNKGFIIGDQTGIGKGRVNAGVMRWALQNGKTPIFVTEKPNLYLDMNRDLTDIGMGEGETQDAKVQSVLNRVFMTNSDEQIPLDDEAMDWYARAEEADAKGEKRPSRSGKFLSTPNGAKQKESFYKAMGSGKLPDGKSIIFTTYSQLQTVKQDRTVRHDFLDVFAPGAILLLDESHTAGGVKTEGKAQGLSRAQYIRDLVSQVGGVFYSSATFAKRPDVMDLYSKTDMQKAVDNPAMLGDAIMAGGIPLQQVVSSMLAESGQLLRRERSFDGVEYATTSAVVDKAVAEHIATSMRSILHFSVLASQAVEAIGKAIASQAKSIGETQGTGKAGAESTNFSSVMHNLISQFLLGLKTQAAVNQALGALQRGEKPVITVANTMESFLNDYADDRGIGIGDPMPITFGDLLMNYLEKSRTVRERKPFQKSKDPPRRLTDDELGVLGVKAFKNAESVIKAGSWANIPVSPIDKIKAELQKAGYRVGEITGRQGTLDYTSLPIPAYRMRGENERSIAGRIRTIQRFNNGDLDALILNRAGSTGLSLHASPSVGSDLRRRHMIIAQAEANIDTHMQMLGRVHRTGQVIAPRYSQLTADIPAETRPAAVLAKKMASLNANTTAARSSALTAKDALDIMNEYGDQAVAGIMFANQELHTQLGSPLKTNKAGDSYDTEDAARKVTGRIPLLPLKDQEQIYREIEEEFKSILESKIALGENKLEAITVDLDAKEIASEVLVAGSITDKSPFAAPARAVTYDTKRQGRSMTLDEIREEVKKWGGDIAVSPDDINKRIAAKISILLDNVQEKARDYVSQETKNLGDAKAEGVQDRIHAQYNKLSQIAHNTPPGTSVSMTTDQGAIFYGIVINLERKGSPKNPTALSSWQMKIAVADAARVLTVPLSRIELGEESINGRIGIRPDSWENVKVAFENQMGMTRENRVILEGNLLAAYSQFSSGQIVYFRRHDGALAQGILMPKSFDLKAAKREKASVMQTSVDAANFLKDSPSDEKYLSAQSGQVKISYSPSRREPSVLFSVPSSKTQGGRWYLNKALLKSIGDDFVKKGSAIMQARFPVSQLQDVLQVVYSQLGEKLKAVNENEVDPPQKFARASTPVSLETNLKALADDATVQALLDNGRLRLVARQADLPSRITVAAGERVAGAVDPKTGQVYLVAENIRPEDITGFLTHEVGVHQAQLNLNQPKAKALRLAHAVVRLVGARRMLGETSFSDVLNQLERMRAAGHTGVKAAFAQAEAAMKALDQNPALLREEALAYLVQQRPNLPLVKRIVVAVRTFLYRAGFRVSLTENDVRALAVSALKGATRQGFDRFTRTPQQEVIDALRIIKEGDDLLFQSPTAQSKALSEILKEIYPDVSIERPMSKEEIGGIEDETGVPIVEGWAVKAPVKQSNGKMGHDYVYFMRGGDKGDRVWIDVSNLKEGSSGSRIYMVAADWAYNNGWVFQGDPAGLSDKAVYRRTETMLASAIKHGTTRHLEPHPKQKLHWTNDDDQNFKALVQKSADNLLAQVPQLKGVHYDFQRRQFEDGDGRPFTDHLFTELAQSRGARAAQAGSTTLKRASFIQSLSSKGGGSRTGGRERLLGAVVRELRQPVSTGGLKGIFYARAYTAEQLAAMAKIGKRPPKSWTERFAGLTDRIGLKLRQAVADQYASLLALDQKAYGGDVVENQTAASAWVKTRLSRSVDGPMNLLLHEAALKMDADGALDVISGSKGLKQILEPLGVEADDFLKWVAGWRADRLKKEDRERLFTDADIAALKALNQGTMPDGRSRAAVYGKALREFSALQKSVMDIAEQAGLIDAKERKAWERDFYVPFYRLAEDTQDARALNAGDGLVRQEAFKRLKGGKDRLNDLLENTVMNWNHLLSASLKNSAARQALINAQRVVYDGGKVAERVDPNKESTKGCVFYRENGKEQWFRVNDPLILEAITSLDFSGLKGPVMGLLRKARMLLTRTTTISPAFKVANLIRDTVQTLAVSKVSAKTAGVGNIVQGWKNYAADSDIRRSLLAGGGAFRFGTSLEGNADALKKLLTKGVRPETILDTPKKLFDLLGSAYRRYEDLGDKLENVNRAALYTQLREQGKSHLYASFQARDLLDFSASGASGAVRFLTAVVPFLNARIQGLDKLGRAATQPAQRGRFAVTLAATTLASVLLYLWFKDDPDFKDREEWDRDTYWWAKIGGVVVRIPKPFEIGALATLLGDRVVEQMVDKEANSKLYLDRLKFTLTQTFAISGPQLLMPALNVWANKDPFTGRPIETTAQQRLSPGLRRNARTSDTAQAASALSGGTLSPVQMDYLIGAYFGWLGRQAVLLADFATRPLTDRAAPDRTPVVGDLVQRFMPTEKTGSKYLTRFYEAAATAERHYADIRELLRRDEKEAARILLQNHAAEIGRLKAYRAAGAELNDWNNQLKMLADLPASKISDEQRTAMRDRLQKAKLHLARAMMEGRAVD